MSMGCGIREVNNNGTFTWVNVGCLYVSILTLWYWYLYLSKQSEYSTTTTRLISSTKIDFLHVYCTTLGCNDVPIRFSVRWHWKGNKNLELQRLKEWCAVDTPPESQYSTSTGLWQCRAVCFQSLSLTLANEEVSLLCFSIFGERWTLN